MYWEKIEGTPSFINFYDAMVRRFNNATFVEIGTWHGQSVMFLAEKVKELKKNIKIYTIDTFKGSEEHKDHPNIVNDTLYEKYLENIEPLKEYITTIRGSSHDVYNQFEDESIDFLFMDGDHSYAAVRKDLQLWYPKVKKDGIIAGHDYYWIDGRVKMAVDGFFLFTSVFNDPNMDCWWKTKT